jgi:hypothetical protein
VVVQPGYLDDQPSIRSFQALLEEGKYYDKVQTIAMQGSTDRNEHELVVYKRNALALPDTQAK